MEFSWIGILSVVGTFLISAFLGRVVIPRIVLISKKRRLFDDVSERKAHQGSVPRLGGLAFFPIFLTSFTVVLGAQFSIGYELVSPHDVDFIREFLMVTGGAAILMFIGMIDDLRGISYKTKFLAQLASAGLLVGGGLWFNDLNGLMGIYHIPDWAGIPLTLLAVVFLVNAYNLIDGIDGLCAGLSMISIGALGVWFVYNNLYIYGMLSAAILGVLSMFFFYNTVFQRLKVFMGDTGSLLLGFLIAFLLLKFFRECPSVTPNIKPLSLLIGLVFIPVFDTMRVFVVRVSKKLSPFHPDRKHIHHQFLDLGFSHLRATGIIILIQVFFILLNVALYRLNINLMLAIDFVLWLSIMMTMQVFRRRKAKRRKRESLSTKHPSAKALKPS